MTITTLNELNLPLMIIITGSGSLLTGILSFAITKYYLNRFTQRVVEQITTNKQRASTNVSPTTRLTFLVKQQHMQLEKWKELAAYRKEFLGNVAHELKTPLFHIQGYIETIMEQDGLPEQTQYYLQRAHSNINRLSRIIEDLELIAILEDRSINLEKEVFDISALIQEVLDDLEMKAQKYEVSIINFVKSPYFVYADREHMRRVIKNLVENAIIHGKKQGTVMIRAKYCSHTKKVYIGIQDDGYGIPPESLPRIFERFYRVDKARSRQRGGTGLGLAIVKHILEAHQERIKVYSKLEQGTTFIFSVSTESNT